MADLLEQMRDHRLAPSGPLMAADPAEKTLRDIGDEQLPQLEKDLYLARTAARDAADLAAALDAASQRQSEMLKQLHLLLARLERSSATGASLHRAEKILRDQIELNVQSKDLLRTGFGKTPEQLPESLRTRLVAASEEQLRISREVSLLDNELAASEQTGPDRQRAGIRRARQIIAANKLAGAAQQAADRLAANNAQAAADGRQLETDFRALVEALKAATAAEAEIDPFDVLGPSLAELAARDKELKDLLDKLQAMIKEASLLRRNPEREELRPLQNMQEDLNNMLVEINRNLPELSDAELIERLKQMLRDALLSMGAAGEALDAADAEALLEQLKVTLSNLQLAEAELRALLAAAGGVAGPGAAGGPGGAGDAGRHRPGARPPPGRQPDRCVGPGRGGQLRQGGPPARPAGLGPPAAGRPRAVDAGRPREVPAGIPGPDRGLLPEHRPAGEQVGEAADPVTDMTRSTMAIGVLLATVAAVLLSCLGWALAQDAPPAGPAEPTPAPAAAPAPAEPTVQPAQAIGLAVEPIPQIELTPEARKAIQRGLAYLASRQNLDGSWDTEYRRNTGVMAVALLAFLASGNPPGRGEYGVASAKGLAYLLKFQKDETSHFYYMSYYAVHAFYFAGGKYWEQWYPEARRQLLARQDPRNGSWNGNILDTGWAVMCLSIPHRYLPVYQR